MNHVHRMPFGVQRDAAGATRFRLWAPSAADVALQLDGALRPLQRRDGGWYEAAVDGVAVGARYAYRIDGGLVVPDPASRRNPDGVHGASEVTDPEAFDWPDDGWRGRPWHEAVVYELHVGCFTPAGTFVAAIDRLDDLAALGVTAIELMPVADFAGRRGWGYDGVLPFAPHAAYGTPDDLKRFVAAAHARGLMVLLDVVYNHFGPDGNYLHAYAAPFFDESKHTPWGAAINFDGPGSDVVRRFFIDNARYWVDEFRFDGLRLDAVHAMHDASPRHFVDELAQALHDGPGRERHVHIVLENDRNDALRLARDADGGVRRATAQWNDDVHHAMHVVATGEVDGYYADYADRPRRLLARALAEGYAYQGELSAYRGAAHGTPSTALPPLAFVNALQNHDQIGNRAFGERISHLAAHCDHEDALRALLACLLLSPAVPMLFMGEEWAASTPFLYFCDFEGDLARAVTDGRRNEFGRFARFSDPSVRARIPDPNDVTTFERSKLRWDERTDPAHAPWLALVARLLRTRRDRLGPWLEGVASGRCTVDGEATLHVHWPLRVADGGHGPRAARGDATLHLLAHLADAPTAVAALPPGDVVYESHPGRATSACAPWSVRVSLDAGR